MKKERQTDGMTRWKRDSKNMYCQVFVGGSYEQQNHWMEFEGKNKQFSKIYKEIFIDKWKKIFVSFNFSFLTNYVISFRE